MLSRKLTEYTRCVSSAQMPSWGEPEESHRAIELELITDAVEAYEANPPRHNARQAERFAT